MSFRRSQAGQAPGSVSNRSSWIIRCVLCYPAAWTVPAEEIRIIQSAAAVADGLLEELKSEKLRVDQWRDKEATRDAVRVTIRDFLWSDKTGLPVALYSEDDVNIRMEDVFRHVFRAYPTVPSPYYENAAA